MRISPRGSCGHPRPGACPSPWRAFPWRGGQGCRGGAGGKCVCWRGKASRFRSAPAKEAVTLRRAFNCYCVFFVFRRQGCYSPSEAAVWHRLALAGCCAAAPATPIPAHRSPKSAAAPLDRLPSTHEGCGRLNVLLHGQRGRAPQPGLPRWAARPFGETMAVGAVGPPLKSLCPFCPTQISHPALSQRLSSPASPPAAEANLSLIPPTAAPT